MLQGLYKDKFHEIIAQLSAINFAVKERKGHQRLLWYDCAVPNQRCFHTNRFQYGTPQYCRVSMGQRSWDVWKLRPSLMHPRKT